MPVGGGGSEQPLVPGAPAELFGEIPSDSWLDMDRVVLVDDLVFDEAQSHGQVRPLHEAKMLERLESLQQNPPVAIMGPDKFLLGPVDSTGMQHTFFLP